MSPGCNAEIAQLADMMNDGRNADAENVARTSFVGPLLRLMPRT